MRNVPPVAVPSVAVIVSDSPAAKLPPSPLVLPATSPVSLSPGSREQTSPATGAGPAECDQRPFA